MATAFQDTPDAFQETTLAWQIEAGTVADDVYNWLNIQRTFENPVYLGHVLR